MNNIPLCYLCGSALTLPVSADHVPPRQLYAPTIRRRHHPKLLTIKVHDACNKAFQRDEDYFVNTLAPLAYGSYAGNATLNEIFNKYHSGHKVGLTHKVLGEFDRRPSGIFLPHGKIAKRFDGLRIKRVALKIVQGLYFTNYGEFLPRGVASVVQIVPPEQRPPEHFFQALKNRDCMGNHPGVFDYKFAKFPEVNDFHYWAMLFWDMLIVLVMFHDPQCACADCKRNKD